MLAQVTRVAIAAYLGRSDAFDLTGVPLRVLAIFRGRGGAGDTTGNSPGSKWTAFNAIARAVGLRPAIHEPYQSSAALVRGHCAQATRARAGRCGVI